MLLVQCNNIATRKSCSEVLFPRVEQWGHKELERTIAAYVSDVLTQSTSSIRCGLGSVSEWVGALSMMVTITCSNRMTTTCCALERRTFWQYSILGSADFGRNALCQL